MDIEEIKQQAQRLHGNAPCHVCIEAQHDIYRNGTTREGYRAYTESQGFSSQFETPKDAVDSLLNEDAKSLLLSAENHEEKAKKLRELAASKGGQP